jgi:hypothetical protein
MKMIAEYLENALKFERLADEEENPELNAMLKKQATAYRNLATERAGKLGPRRHREFRHNVTGHYRHGLHN